MLNDGYNATKQKLSVYGPDCSGMRKNLYIKNVYCRRCIDIVRSELSKVGIYCFELSSEMIIARGISISEAEYNHLKINLIRNNFTLIDEHKSCLVERIESVIFELIYSSEAPPKSNISDLIANMLNLSYTYLSNLYKEVTDTTIEQSIIQHKVERAKEMILYEDVNLTEISFQLNYSSVAHLSSQFKKVTGMTPTDFKNRRKKSKNRYP